MPARPYRERPPVEPEPMGQGASETARLGSQLSVHAPPALHRVLLRPVLITSLVVVIGASGGASLFVLAALAAVTLAILLWSPLRIRGWSAALHAHGLVLLRPGARRVVAFEDVNEVWFEVPRVHSQAGAYLRALRLVDYSGEEHRVPLAVNEGATLASSVLRGCSGPLLIEARRAIEEGEVLTFGQVQLDRAGITVGGARRTWPEIRLAVMSHARMHLYGRFPLIAWRTVRLDRIPNPTVFIGLVAQRAARMRIDDLFMTPLASKVEGQLARTLEVDNDFALRSMLVGGLVFVASVTIAWEIYSANSPLYALALWLAAWGAARFFQGLATLRFGPHR